MISLNEFMIMQLIERGYNYHDALIKEIRRLKIYNNNLSIPNSIRILCRRKLLLCSKVKETKFYTLSKKSKNILNIIKENFND